MIRVYNGRDIPLEEYHGVPPGWRAGEIRREHSKLKGTFDLDGPEATEQGAPSFLVHRYEWLQYREALRRVGDGVRAGDSACIEIAIRFIELHHIGSYSGYVRTRLARALKSVELKEDQKRRLHGHFLSFVTNQEKVDEFTDYVRLWKRFLTREQKAALLLKVRMMQNGEARANWLSTKIE